MTGTEPPGQNNLITGINVTPLVDITLVLLIVFMVTATYIVRSTLEVELPRAASGGDSVGKTLNIVLKQATGDGAKASRPCNQVALDGKLLDEASLSRALKQAAGEDAAVKATLGADQDCRHREFVGLVDLVKQAGISKFAIQIEKIGEPPR